MTAKPSSVTISRILLAEDDDSMRGFLVRALKKAGYDVIAYPNGEEAFERLKSEPFTLLLTDIVMPKMDGIELARRASELDPDLKIMFITGFAAVALNPDNHAPKDAKILSKPFHLRDLVDQVERLLAA
jgi:two-component system, cell cycle response regulator CpdR